MKLPHALEFCLRHHRCLYRTLTVDDVTADYVDALMNQRRYLLDNPPSITLEWQKAYVRQILESESDTITGLFVDGELVATSGIQRLRHGAVPTIGIFVLKASNRGRGFGKAVVWAASRLACLGTGLARLEAGMERDNLPSLRSFLACGFSVIHESAQGYRVAGSVEALRPPQDVSDVRAVPL